MSNRDASGVRTRDLWFGPLLAWVGLMVLFAINLASSYVPLGRANVVINLLIAAVMAATLFIVLMDLRNAKALVRVAAVAGLFWMMMMFSLTFSDYLSRTY
jgi:cytochrome c oxidase subunit IV